jgi:hypothetical protein
MVAIVPGLENHTLMVNQEIQVRSSLASTFKAILDQMGPENGYEEHRMPMTLEPWPGGRWFRDLGEGNGHFWGVVQAIKKPTLLEITGPLMMSYPVVSNLQYRLKEVPGGTLITFHHLAFGLIPDEVRDGLSDGWKHMLEAIRKRAETE